MCVCHELNIRWRFSGVIHPVFETGSLTGLLSRLGWLARKPQTDRIASTSNPRVGITAACPYTQVFYVGSEDLVPQALCPLSYFPSSMLFLNTGLGSTGSRQNTSCQSTGILFPDNIPERAELRTVYLKLHICKLTDI